MQDLSGVTPWQLLNSDNSKLLHRAACEHLLREGRMDVAETLINVCGQSVGLLNFSVLILISCS